MASVMRQFESLTKEPVMDESCGEMVDIVGLCRTHGGTRLTLVSTGETTGVYSADLDEVSL